MCFFSTEEFNYFFSCRSSKIRLRLCLLCRARSLPLLRKKHNYVTGVRRYMYCMQCMYSLRADASQYDIIAISFPHSTSSPTSGGTTGVETVHRTGAHGPRGPIQAHTIRQSQYNTPLLSANCLFINGPIINNIFLKIMDTLFRFYS